MWSHLPADQLREPRNGALPSGTRVAKLGTVSFERSGIARVRWDDGTMSEEWGADLTTAPHPRKEQD